MSIVFFIICTITIGTFLFKGNRLSNFWRIINDYIKIMLTDKINNKSNLFFYIILPVVYGVYFGINTPVSKEIINIVGIVFSIMTGVLFTFLSMLISVTDRFCSSYKKQTRKIIINETFSIIMFEITIAILILLATILSSLILIEVSTFVTIITNSVYYSLIMIFLFDFLIIVKRIYNLYKDIINNN